MSACTACWARPIHAHGYCRVCEVRAKNAGLLHPERLGAQIPCACGCGTLLYERDPNGRARRFVRGHNPNKRRIEPRAALCACGCGTIIADRTRFAGGHRSYVVRFAFGHKGRPAGRAG